MREINRAVMKKDALALVTGKPVYTEDIAPSDCLVVKALRSPHAHAIVRSVDKSMALKVPGIECCHRNTYIRGTAERSCGSCGTVLQGYRASSGKSCCGA